MRIRVASAAGVAERYREQYRDGDGWKPLRWGDSTPETKYVALCAATSPDEAAKIIGNQSWTHPWCKSCEDHVPIAVEIGIGEPAAICLPCLRAAQAALDVATRFLKEEAQQ